MRLLSRAHAASRDDSRPLYSPIKFITDDSKLLRGKYKTSNSTALPREEDFVQFKFELGYSPFIAVGLCTASIVLLIVCAAVVVPITRFNVILNSTGTIVYTAGTTIAAGAVAAFITGQIKELSVRDTIYIAPHTVSYSKAVTWLRAQLGYDDSTSIRRARSALGIGRATDQAVFWPQTFSLLIGGLITTGLVTGLAPDIYQSASVAVQWSDDISRQECTSRSNDLHPGPNAGDSVFNWTSSDGSWIASALGNSDRFESPCADAMTQITQLFWTSNPIQGTAYSIGGVPVRPGAIGVPFVSNLTDFTRPSIFSYLWPGQDSNQTSSIFGTGQFTGSQACLPVLSKNPVQCKPSYGRPLITSNGSAIVIGDGCNATLSQGVNRTANVCTAGMPVGKAKIVISDGPYLLNSHFDPQHLSDMYMGFGKDLKSIEKINPGLEDFFTLTCTVDIPDSIQFQKVKLKYLGQVSGEADIGQVNVSSAAGLMASNPTSSYIQYVVGGNEETCVPTFANGTQMRLEDIALPEAMAHAAAGSWDIIQERIATDPRRTASLDSLVVTYGYATLANPAVQGLFPDSQTVLEDTLGAIHGAALSSFYGISYACASADMQACQEKYSGVVVNTGSGTPPPYKIDFPLADMTASSMQVGPGDWRWCIIYLIPELWALGQLSWLLRRHYAFVKNGKLG